MIVQEPVQASIWHCLNHYAYNDAIFLSERLYAEVGSDEALFLLATCYYRSGKLACTYSTLHNKDLKNAQCRFLLAKCCYDLSKMSEAESVLTGSNIVTNKTAEDVGLEFSDSGSFAVQLLGQICSRTERHNKASDAFNRSLKLNPFLWSSYKSLCDLGNKPEVSKVFQVKNLESFYLCQGSNALVNLVNNHAQSSAANMNNSTLIISDNNVNQQEINLHQQPFIMTPVTSDIYTPPYVPSYVRSTPKAAELLPSSIENSPLDVATPDGSYYSISSNQIINRGQHLLQDQSKVTTRVERNLLGNAPGNSPLAPNFGILPLETPSPAGEYLRLNTSIAFISPSPQTVTDFKDGKPPSKRVIGRTPQSKLSTKPPVFSLSSNTTGLNYSSNVSIHASSSPTPTLQQNVTNVRRSSRLFSNNSNSVKENNKTLNKSNRFASPKVPPRRTKARSVKSTTMSQPAFNDLNELNKSGNETVTGENKVNSQYVNSATMAQTALSLQKSSAEGLMNLLQQFAIAYKHLSLYECQKVIDTLSELPARHYNTGWVISCIGRAHFELAQYEQAAMMYKCLKETQLLRMDGMEYYSTALWHLQREIALSTLANELIEFDKHSPQAWCATGNCFSLQKEHDTAIKFFERAVQVDPNFAYPYTLLGHEYVVSEELDKAMSCYRNAIRIDPRHYNAWYGIGMIYYKLEKFQLAEIHFKRSLSINPQSSVLMCHVAVVQHALQKTEVALLTLNKAIASNPKNPLCKFHRASIYFASDRHQEALVELEELKEIVPKESLVYFLIGKVHKKLGNTHLALMNFSWAMDLDPKGANNQMKEAIDKRYANDDDDAVVANETLDDLRRAGGNVEREEELSHNSSALMEAEEEVQQNMESDESL